MLYNYSYIMMDKFQFEKYQKMCKKNGWSCNYNRIGTDCYGVMVSNEKRENNVEEVQKINAIDV